MAPSNVVLPPQMTRQIARANELQSGPAPSEDPPEVPTPPEDEGVEGVEESMPPAAEVSEPPGEPPPPVTTPPVDDGFKAQYETLKGKYNADIRRLQEQVKILTDKLAAPPPPPPPPPPEPEHASPEEIERYGEDLVQLIERRARAIAATTTVVQERELKLLREQVRQFDTQFKQSQNNSFLAAMDAAMDGWREQDMDQGFVDWCNQTPHPDLPGMTYSDLLDAAVKSADVGRVCRVLLAYPRATATPKGAPPTPPAPPARTDTGAKPKADTAVMPPRGRAAVVRETDKPWVKLSEITAHGRAFAKGELKGDEYRKRKAIIDDAIREGRILQG